MEFVEKFSVERRVRPFRGVASTLAKANADNGSFVVGRTTDAASDATDVRYNDVLYVIPTPDANYEVASVTVNGTQITSLSNQFGGMGGMPGGNGFPGEGDPSGGQPGFYGGGHGGPGRRP